MADWRKVFVVYNLSLHKKCGSRKLKIFYLLRVDKNLQPQYTGLRHI